MCVSFWRVEVASLAHPARWVLASVPIRVNVGVISLLLVAVWRVSGMMSFRLSSDTAGSGFPEKSSGDADHASDRKITPRHALRQ